MTYIRQYFQMYFHERKVLYLGYSLIKVCPSGPIDSNPSLVEIMA